MPEPGTPVVLDAGAAWCASTARVRRTLLVAIIAAVAALSVAAALRRGAAQTAIAPPVLVRDGAVRVTADAAKAELLISLDRMELPACGEGVHAAYALQVPVDGWLRGYEVVVTDTSGRRLPRDLLHHLNLFAPSEPELFMPLMRRVLGAGTETGRVRLPPLFAYRMAAGDSLLLVVMLHNRYARAYGPANVQLRMDYEPVHRRVPRITIVPFYLDVMMEPTPTRSFAVPPGRTEMSWSGSPVVPGRILGLGGHVHQHAVELRLEDVTAGTVIWRTRPRVDSAGNVTAVPVRYFVARLGVPVRPDHVYRITVVYQNDTNEPTSGMGVIGGIFMPARGATWRPVQRAAPLYANDRHNIITGTVTPHGVTAGGGAAHAEPHAAGACASENRHH
jgi:hypothetical protein